MRKANPKANPSANQQAWLFALLLVTAGLLLIWLKADLYYAETDDAPTVRALLGYEGGHIPTFHVFQHPLLTFLLAGLSRWVPGIAWYSWVQLACLWLAGVVLVKSFCQMSIRSQGRMLPGMAVSTLFFGVFLVECTALLTYTTTAALLGAAAVAQLCTLRVQEKAAWGMAGSMGLLLAAYAWRLMSALPALAFWLLALGWQAWQEGALFAAKGKPKPPRGLALYGKSLALCLACFALLYGIRALDVKAQGLEGYMDWQNARNELFDYTDFQRNPNTQAGQGLWSAEETRLISGWYLLDEKITAEAMRQQASSQRPNALSLAQPVDSLAQLAHRAWVFFRLAWQWVLATALVVGSAAFSIWQVCQAKDQRRGSWLWGLLALLGTGLFEAYLLWVDRMLTRTFVSALIPAAAFIACLLLSARTDPARTAAYRRGQRVCAILLTGLALLSSYASYRDVTSPYYQQFHDDNDRTAWALEAFARDNPDKLIVYGVGQWRDCRLFPSQGQPVPQNLAAWGGWDTGSLGQQKQFALLGLDRNHFTARDFLRGNVLALGDAQGPPQELTEYVAGALGQAPQVKRYGSQDGVCFYGYEGPGSGGPPP